MAGVLPAVASDRTEWSDYFGECLSTNNFVAKLRPSYRSRSSSPICVSPANEITLMVSGWDGDKAEMWHARRIVATAIARKEWARKFWEQEHASRGLRAGEFCREHMAEAMDAECGRRIAQDGSVFPVWDTGFRVATKRRPLSSATGCDRENSIEHCALELRKISNGAWQDTAIYCRCHDRSDYWLLRDEVHSRCYRRIIVKGRTWRTFAILATPTVLFPAPRKPVPADGGKCEHGVHINPDNGKAEWCDSCFDIIPPGVWRPERWDGPEVIREGVRSLSGRFLGVARSTAPSPCRFGRHCGTCTLGSSIENTSVTDEEKTKKVRRKESRDLSENWHAKDKGCLPVPTVSMWSPYISNLLRWEPPKAAADIQANLDREDRDRLLPKRRALPVQERLFCSTHKQLQWVTASDGTLRLSKCGCHLDLGAVASSQISKWVERLAGKAQDSDLEGEGENHDQDEGEGAAIREERTGGVSAIKKEMERVEEDEADREREWLPDTTEECEWITEGDDDISEPQHRRGKNQLIEGCDDVEADWSGVPGRLTSKGGVVWLPRQNPKQPPQFTAGKITSLLRHKGIKLTPDEKTLLLWLAYRLPGERNSHKLSREEIGERMGKTEDWVRYHSEIAQKKFRY